jgi:hypothetical protein
VVGLVEVDEVVCLLPIAVDHLDGELELVAATRGSRALDAERCAELAGVELVVRALACLGVRPPLCELAEGTCDSR